MRVDFRDLQLFIFERRFGTSQESFDSYFQVFLSAKIGSSLLPTD